MGPCGSCGLRGLCIRRIELFSGLDDLEFAALHRLVRHRDLPAHRFLFHAGDPFADVVIVRSGSLQLIRHGPDGEEIVTDRLKAGDAYGGDLLFDADVNRDSGYVPEPSAFCLIRREAILDLIAEKPQLALKLLAELSRRLNSSRQRLMIAGIRDVSKRLAAFLLSLPGAERGEIADWSQEAIARSLNLTKETVNRKMKVLVDLGLISLTGYRQIRIRDFAGLADFAGQSQ